MRPGSHLKRPKITRRRQRRSAVTIPVNQAGSLPGPFRQMLTADPFPQSFTCVLNYCYFNQLFTGISGVYGAERVFRLNSVYDPDFTGSGHQPYGFDQISPLYRRYMVNQAKFEILFSNPSADSVACSAMLQSSAGTQVLTGALIDEAAERPNVVTRFLNGTGSQTVSISQPWFSLSSIEGVRPSMWQDQADQYGATVGANPSLVPYLRIANASGLAATGVTVELLVKVSYRVRFYERVGLAQS